MLFMVIERFKDGNAAPVYQRFRARGRMLPDGLKYIDSWVAADRERCFQLMACADLKLFDEWIAHWQDLVEFEIIPVTNSTEVAEPLGSTL
jgi:Protein of unknown function (DUF3303)